MLNHWLCYHLALSTVGRDAGVNRGRSTVLATVFATVLATDPQDSSEQGDLIILAPCDFPAESTITDRCDMRP